jgi:hypothetical protein
MTVVVRGSAQVAALERALGGPLPKAVIQKSGTALKRYATEQAKATREARAEILRLSQPRFDLLLAHIPKDDPRLRKQIETSKAAYEQRRKRKLKAPRTEKFEASLALGSIQAVRVPPYDGTQHYGNAHPSVAGGYDMNVHTWGDGGAEAWAALGVGFHSPDDNPQQRVAAYLVYSYDYWVDECWPYASQNNLRTRLWVWGDAEGKWVTQTDVSPRWTRENGQGHDQDLHETVEAWFPARASSWYAAWVWSDTYVYGDSGFFGASSSGLSFVAGVPLIVFGSLS